MAQSFRIEGLSDLLQALTELPKATGKNVLKRALIKAAGPMQSQAESMAPVETGGLKASIVIGTKLSRRQAAAHRREVGSTPAITVGGFRSAPQTAVYVFVGPAGSPKSIVQEFGGAHQAPHSYMRPAWDANKNSALDSISGDLEQEIENARKRLARKAEREAARMKVA